MKSIERLLLAATVLLTAGRGRAAPPSPFVKLFDTRSASPAPLAADALATRAGWAVVPAGKMNHVFAGDAVFANDKLAVALRRNGAGADVYAVGPDGPAHRALLIPKAAPAGPATALTALKVVRNTPAAVELAATFRAKAGTSATVSFRLTTGVMILETRPGKGAAALLVRDGATHVVIPEFFGDDMVVSADRVEAPRLDLPAENILIGLTAGGDCLTVCVWPSHRQNAAMIVGKDQTGAGCEVEYLPGKSIWLAVLTGKGIWHAREVNTAATRPAWKPPFPARWRGTLFGPGGMGQSHDVSGTLPTTSGRAARLAVYPLDRTRATPLSAFTAMDVLRNTLGVGPCQYLLAAEGIGGEAPAAVDFVTHWVERLFERKRAKRRADEISERLGQMTAHVRRADARIGRYRDFAAGVRKLCGDSDVARKLLLPIVADIDRLASPPSGPAAPKKIERIANAMSALIGRESALAECRRLGAEARAVAARQDRAIANCRMAVRRLKQACRSFRPVDGPQRRLAAQVQLRAEGMLAGGKAEGAKP